MPRFTRFGFAVRTIQSSVPLPSAPAQPPGSHGLVSQLSAPASGAAGHDVCVDMVLVIMPTTKDQVLDLQMLSKKRETLRHIGIRPDRPVGQLSGGPWDPPATHCDRNTFSSGDQHRKTHTQQHVSPVTAQLGSARLGLSLPCFYVWLSLIHIYEPTRPDRSEYGLDI